MDNDDIKFHKITKTTGFYEKRNHEKIWYASKFGNTNCANLLLSSCSIFDGGHMRQHDCVAVLVKELDDYISFLEYIRDDIRGKK